MLNYTPIILAIVIVVRILVLYKASKIWKKCVAKIIKKEGFSKEDADK